jgi:hypothetical protein
VAINSTLVFLFSQKSSNQITLKRGLKKKKVYADFKSIEKVAKKSTKGSY